MPDLTPKLGIKKPLGNETVSRAAFNENWDIIDQNVVGDKGGVPTIQAGLDADKPAAGTSGRVYIATDTKIIYQDSGAAWEKRGVVNWNDVDGKPSSYPPNAHKLSHATAGSDELTPGDIGAETPAGAQSKADTAESNANTYTNGLVGTLANLLTTAKDNLVNAINEIYNSLTSHTAETATEDVHGLGSHVGQGGTEHAEATTSVAGFMSASDKIKLNGVEDGATNGFTLNSGSFIENTSIGGNSTYTKSVALGSNDYKLAIVRFTKNDNTVWDGALVIAKNTVSSGSSLSVGGYSDAIGGMRTVQNYLTSNGNRNSNKGVSGNSYICLEHCYINGSNLEFKWRNIGGSSAALDIAVQWEVLK